MNTFSFGFWAFISVCILACLSPPTTFWALIKQPARQFWTHMLVMALFIGWHSVSPAHDLCVKGLAFLIAIQIFSIPWSLERWIRMFALGVVLAGTLRAVLQLHPWDLWAGVPFAVWLSLVLGVFIVWTEREYPVHLLGGAVVFSIICQFVLLRFHGAVETPLQHDLYYMTLFDTYWMTALFVCAVGLLATSVIHRNPSQERADLTKRHS